MSCKRHRVQDRRVKRQTEQHGILGDKAHIEGCIVRHQAAALAEFQKLRQDHVDLRCREDHVVVDARQLLNLKRDRHIRVDKGTELIGDHALFYLHRTDLDDLIFLRAKAGGLDIEHHKGVRKGLAPGVFYQLLHIVNQVAFHTVEHLKRIVFIQRMAGLREGLHASMVSNCQRFHSPLLGFFDDARHIGHTIHIAHLGMAMQLHALHRTVVHTFAGEIFCFLNTAHRTDRQFAVKPVDRCHAAQTDEGSRLDRRI